jgi:hypothetical protein
MIYDAAITKMATNFLKACKGDLAVANEYLTHAIEDAASASASAGRRPDDLHAKGKTGPKRRPLKMPTAAQKAGARYAAAKMATTILDTHRVSDGRALGDVRWPELRQMARNVAAEGAKFLRRGYEHVAEGLLIGKIAHQATPSDPNAAVREVMKPAVVERLKAEAEVEAMELIHQESHRVAINLAEKAYPGVEDAGTPRT